MRDLPLRLRRFADDAHEVVVRVTAPVGRIERAFGLRWRRDELLLGGERGADVRHQSRRGDGGEPAHHVAASQAAASKFAHRPLAIVRVAVGHAPAPLQTQRGHRDIPSPAHPAASSTLADGYGLTPAVTTPEARNDDLSDDPGTSVPIALLSLSNVFMTFAWYGHLRFKEQPLPWSSSSPG